MTGEPRAELARIAAGLRRRLEHEHAAGLGDLLARGSRAPRRAAASAVQAPASLTTASAPAADPPRASAAVASAKAPPAPEVDLFGAPVRVAVEAAPTDARPRVAPLNPVDPREREAIAAAATPVLAAIASEVRACQKCALWEARAQAVPGVGGALSGIVFIGEAPGADEDRLGEPFVGRAGQLLDRIIQAMSDRNLIPGVALNRETVFIGNILHCRPPQNRVPLPIEVEMSSPYLLRQLDALKPRVICCLGKTSGEFLLGTKANLGAMRGHVYRWKGAKLIVTYHPAACLRNPEHKQPVWEDMQLLAREYLSD
jgi:DNA polymerase